MRVGIYTPYLDSFGGGERYMLTIAEILSQGHTVDLFLDSHHLTLDPKSLIQKLATRLNLDLSKINLVPAPIGPGSSFLKRIFFLKKYDLMIYLTDGSIFYSSAKRSLLHFQVPFKNISGLSFWNKIKLSSWDLAICNSKFTQNIIKKEWSIKSQVLYPPVEVDIIKPLTKKKQILSVGRFASFSKSKKHEEMIKAFKDLYQAKKINGWSLHLVGSIEGDEGYVQELKDLAKDLPVVFYPNCPYKDLVKLYGESCIYWHAAGFEESDPTQMEHFGISTVEAMAGGCVPVVINLGGQKEIVEDGISGYLWDNIEELKQKTYKLINNEKLRKEIGKTAVQNAKKFSVTRFTQEIRQLADGNN